MKYDINQYVPSSPKVFESEDASKGLPWLEMTGGKNLLRLYPSHSSVRCMLGEKPVVGDSYFWKHARYWLFLPDPNTEKKQDTFSIKHFKNMFNIEEKLRLVCSMDSVVHGDTPKSLMQEYWSVLKKHIEQREEDPEVLRRNYSRIFRPTVSYVFYAHTYPERRFGLFNMKASLYESFQNTVLSFGENGEDPFTNPVNGVVFYVNKNEDALKRKNYKDVYSCGIHLKEMKPVLDPLETEDMDKLLSEPSLMSMFQNVFTVQDLQSQIDFLKVFDDLSGVRIFDNAELKSQMNSIYTQNKELVEKQNPTEEESPPAPKPDKPVKTIRKEVVASTKTSKQTAKTSPLEDVDKLLDS